MAAPCMQCALCESAVKERSYRSLTSKTSLEQYEYCFKTLSLSGITGVACNICVNKLNRVNKLNSDLNEKLRLIKEQRDKLLLTLKDMPGVRKHTQYTDVLVKQKTPRGEKRSINFVRQTPTPRSKVKSMKKLFSSPGSSKLTSKSTITMEKETQTTRAGSSDFEVKLTVRYNGTDRSRIVQGHEKSALKAMANCKKPVTVMKSFMKMESYKSAMLQIVKHDISQEVNQLVKKNAGLFKNTTDLVHFDWKEASERIQTLAPSLFDILSRAIMLDSKKCLPKLMTSIFILLYGRCQRVNQLQFILGLVVDQCGLTKEGQQLLHSLGVTVSPTSIHKKRKLLVQEQSKRIEETVTSYVRKKEEEYNMYKEEAIYATSDKAHTPDEDVASSSTCTTAVKFTVQPGVLNMSQNTKYEDEKLMQLESGCSADMIENHGGKPSEQFLMEPGTHAEDTPVSMVAKSSSVECTAAESSSVECTVAESSSVECTVAESSSSAECTVAESVECSSDQREKQILPIEILGDNLDLTISPTKMTMDQQRKSLHWFLVLVKQKRITADLMDDWHVLENNEKCMHTHKWIPSASELDTLEQHLTFHVAHILFKYIDFLEPVRECFPSYITHKFMQQTKMKSVFLNCDLIEASENSSQGMIEILQRVHQIAVPHTNSDVLERVVFGGDCLTNERAFSAQQAMQNDPSKFSSLKGVVHRPEGLHREMNFLLGIYQLFYKETSSDSGTLYQLRNVINRRDVTGPENVIQNFRSHHQFIEDVTDGYIIAAFLDLMDMDSVHSSPKRPPVFSLMDDDARIKCVLHLSSKVLEAFQICRFDSVRDIRQNMEALDSDYHNMLQMQYGGSFKCALCGKEYTRMAWLRRHLEKKHDWLFHIPSNSSRVKDPITTFLFMSLLYRDTCDSYRMGDGDRIVLNAKLEWLYASSMNHYKYKLWLWRMLAYVIAILDPKEAFEYKWNMTVNLTGGFQNNIPNDNCVEIQVHKIKSELKAQGANKSFESAKLICMTTQVVDGIKQQLLRSTSTHRSKRTRPPVDKLKDVVTIANTLRKNGYVRDLKWETFKSFKDPISCIDTFKLNEWANTQMKIASLYL